MAFIAFYEWFFFMHYALGFLCLTASFSSSLMAYASMESYDRLYVAKLDILAENLPIDATFDEKVALQRIKTQQGDPFSQLVFDEDLKELAEEYDRVEPSLDVHNGQLYVTIRVWVRPTIRSIIWNGNEHIKTKTLQKELDVKLGTLFHRQNFRTSFNKVQEFYIKKGYFASELDYQLVTDPKTNEVDVHITVKEGHSGLVGAILFEGFTKEEQSAILGMIYTKKYNLFLSWLTGDGVYLEEASEQDQLIIANYLQNEGYADAKVQIRTEDASPGKIAVIIHADRGDLYHFDKITFQGNTLFPDDQIEREFVARPGDIYSLEKLRMTAQNIKELYGRKGYIEANVQFETRQRPDSLLYGAEFLISEGEQYKIGIIHVTGNIQTKTSVILRESLLIPGEVFDSAKLKATQQRLEGIGYFKNVNVYAVRTQDDVMLGDYYRDVYIEVEETTTGSISLFFGFSSADSVFGGLDFSETNFNYKGLGSMFTEGLSALRGGGEFLRARASVGKKQNSYTLSWLDPYFRDSLWRLGVESSYATSELQAKDYYTNTLSGSVYTSYPLNALWTFGSRYRIKQTLAHIRGDAPSQEKQQAGHDGLLSALSSSMTFDSTDSALKPRRGFRSFMEGEFAGIGGDICFLRLRYINSYYTPLWSKGTMKYRCDLQFIEPLAKTHSPNDVFVSERFFLGGENTVRGYKAFHLGPLFVDNNGKVSTDPKGGISSTLLSMEYLQEVFKMLDLFLFIDAGALSMERFQIPTLRFSYGFGARIDLLNRIPLVLGWGFPVNPLHNKQVDRFFFSMGGQF